MTRAAQRRQRRTSAADNTASARSTSSGAATGAARAEDKNLTLKGDQPRMGGGQPKVNSDCAYRTCTKPAAPTRQRSAANRAGSVACSTTCAATTCENKPGGRRFAVSVRRPDPGARSGQLAPLPRRRDLRPRGRQRVVGFAATSWVQPTLTAEITAVGVTHVLEAIREVCPEARFYQASGSEMFGKVLEVPQTEDTPFYPRSPNGVAKANGRTLATLLSA
jgi:hypothetical protein